MEVVRTIYVPLAREPDILFGLRLSDIIWVGMAGAGDLAIWHGWMVAAGVKVAIMASVSLAGLGMALVRIEDATLPEWMMRLVRFCSMPRLYLP